MRIIDYLEDKYGVGNATTMLSCEARVFGIRGKLQKGWLSRIGSVEITPDMANKLKAELARSSAVSAVTGIQILNSAWIELKSKPAANSRDFLQSKAWKRLRLIALNAHGRKCQCCGAGPENGAVLNVDHIKPRSLFPLLALSLGNLQVLCSDCNEGKGNWDMTDCRKAY